MFKSIRKNYVSGTVVVNGLYRIVDDRGVLKHYVASLHMRLEGKARNILAEFYPEQAEKLCEVIGVASLNQNVHQNNPAWMLTIRVELLDVRKARFSETCTAKLINAEFTPVSEQMLVKSGRYLPYPKLDA